MAPPMANAITIDDGNRLLNTAKTSAVAAVAPTIAIREARREIGKSRERNSSAIQPIADIGKARMDRTPATRHPKSRERVPVATTHISKTAKNTVTGASTRNTNALFIAAILCLVCPAKLVFR